MGLTNQNCDDFSSVRVGACGIRPKNGHIGGRTDQNRDGFSSARVGAYGIRPTNGHVGGQMNQNRDDFSPVRVGAYGIRHTNGHIRGRTNQNRDDFSSVRVGVYGIRPTNEHIGGRMNQNHGDFSSVRVGAYGIRPTNEHIRGRTNQNRGDFFVRCRSGKGWLGGDGLLLFVGRMKIGGVLVQIFLRDGERADQCVRLLFSDRTMGAYAIRPYPDGRKGGMFFVRCRSGKGWLGGGGLLLPIDSVWNGVRGLGDVGRDRK